MAAIEAENLTKHYRVYLRPVDRLKEALTRRVRYQLVEALRDVSLRVPHGNTLGIIGENGAGKSTLLKILAGTVHPTAGNLSRQGRVAALLELGSGFHPEFSGRGNIHLNAALNHCEERLATIEGDAFEALKGLRQAREKFDLVIVDPPAFIKRKKDFKEGLNAYHRIVNATSSPALLLGGTTAPNIMNLVGNRDFIFNCPYSFSDRLSNSIFSWIN